MEKVYESNRKKLIRDSLLGIAFCFALMIAVVYFTRSDGLFTGSDGIFVSVFLLMLSAYIYKIATSLEKAKITDDYVMLKRVKFGSLNKKEIKFHRNDLYDLGLKVNNKGIPWLIIIKLKVGQNIYKDYRFNVVYFDSQELIMELKDIVNKNYINDRNWK